MISLLTLPVLPDMRGKLVTKASSASETPSHRLPLVYSSRNSLTIRSFE